MEIAFHSRALRDICESDDMLSERFGKKVSKQIKKRLADLRAATSIKDLVVGNPRELPNQLHPTITLDLCDGFRVLFRANHARRPASAGSFDWSVITRVKIMSIGSDHDQGS